MAVDGSSKAGGRGLPQRRSVRLPGFDYASRGAYFVTICTTGRVGWLAAIAGDDSVLSTAGAVVADYWWGLSDRHSGVVPDALVVMPNHLHGVLWLGRCSGAGTVAPPTLGEVVRTLKAASARQIRDRVAPDFAWQRNYWEHIIRDDDDLQRIREYIAENPSRWAQDPENPERRESP